MVISACFNQSDQPVKINNLFRSWRQVFPSGHAGWVAVPLGLRPIPGEVFYTQRVGVYVCGGWLLSSQPLVSATQRGGAWLLCQVKGYLFSSRCTPTFSRGLLWKRFPEPFLFQVQWTQWRAVTLRSFRSFLERELNSVTPNTSKGLWFRIQFRLICFRESECFSRVVCVHLGVGNLVTVPTSR